MTKHEFYPTEPPTPVYRLDAQAVRRRFAGISEMTLYRWYMEKDFPNPHHIGKKRMWYLHEIEEWEQAEMNRRRPETIWQHQNIDHQGPKSTDLHPTKVGDSDSKTL